MASAVREEVLAGPLLSDRFRPLAHVVWARQAETTILLDTERGLYYTLNEVAGRTWDLLVAGEPFVEMLRCLGDEFETAPETIESDTATLIGWLLAAALIEVAR